MTDVIKNEESIPLVAIERFSFDLCVLYQRATKIVSRPAPLYYAHRAAFLGPYYDKGFRDGGTGWETSSTSSGGSNTFIGTIKDSLKRKLYYA